jgi:hypothetical protein
MAMPEKRVHCLVLTVLLIGHALPVRAQEAEAPAESAVSPSAPTTPSRTSSPAWGWILIGSSMALGAAMTASGLAVECRGEERCRIDTSLLVWGGIGVASVGSMFGFLILERAENTNDPNALLLTARGRF